MAKLYWQGALDGLCVLYSVINAVESLCSANKNTKLKDDDIQSIFRILCDLLSEEGRLQDVLVEGMGFRNLGRLFDGASQYLEKHRSCLVLKKVAFSQYPDSLDKFWSKMV